MYYTSRKVYEYISKLKKDPIVQWKICKVSGLEFPIYKSDMIFYDKISPVILGIKYIVSPPTLCPEERQRRRLMFRNERMLYKRKCDATGEHIISIYSPEKPYKVYNHDYRWSDKRSPMSYGQEIDFDKTFTEQFGELMQKVPKYSLSIAKTSIGNYNYANQVTALKDCYFLFNSNSSENCYYGKGVEKSDNCIDCLKIYDCHICYEAIFCHNCTDCFYVQDLNTCSFCSFSRKLQNCHHCFGCTNLTDKTYCIFNKQYTKREYDKIVNALSGENNIGKIIKELKLILPDFEQIGCEGCIGDYLSNCKNTLFCFDGERLENAKYCTDIKSDDNINTLIYDISYFGSNISLSYECVSIGNTTNNAFFSHQIRPANNVRYCDACHDNTSNCFGCVGLRNASYCIFNKQYSKEEYEKMMAKLIVHMQSTGEWGEFFDPSLSNFGYNETLAQNHFPLTREEALVRGYKRQDYSHDTIIPEGMHILKGDKIPIDASIVSDDIIKKIFVCEISERPFTIIKQELDFYRKHRLPLPRKHPEIRHQ